MVLVVTLLLVLWVATSVDDRWLGILLGLLVAVPLMAWVVYRALRPLNKIVTALRVGNSNFRAGDFSTSIYEQRSDELGALVRSHNVLGEQLRSERRSIYQRELLLDTLIQATPLAVLLANQNGRIIYSNGAAKTFLQTSELDGVRLTELLTHLGEDVQALVEGGRDGLCSIEGTEGTEFYYLSSSRFVLNTQPHQLYLFKHLTQTLNQREVDTWKKVIRVISHELNNSLAPISSMANSGQKLLAVGQLERLEKVFATIGERAAHLRDFIAGYAQFARLPVPHPEDVLLGPFLEGLQVVLGQQVQLRIEGQVSRFDPAQIEQLCINLLKNAFESGAPAESICLEMVSSPQDLYLTVSDGGPGMSDDVMLNALLPFYSTKKTGTGLGLSLCREIVEAHGGRIYLENKPEGGLKVKCWLPQEGVKS